MHIDHRSSITHNQMDRGTGVRKGLPHDEESVEVALSEQPGRSISISRGPGRGAFPGKCGRIPACTLPIPPFDSKALSKVEELLRKAKYPLVAIGLTMNRAGHPGAPGFVEKHRLPAVTTLMAKGHIPKKAPNSWEWWGGQKGPRCRIL